MRTILHIAGMLLGCALFGVSHADALRLERITLTVADLDRSEVFYRDGLGFETVRSAVYDTSGKQISEAPVDLRVCECCPTAAAVTADGPIIAYRDRSPKEIRDIYISRLVDGSWTEPVAVHNDNWHIAACPVNGPALSARGRSVAVAWCRAFLRASATWRGFMCAKVLPRKVIEPCCGV